MNTTNHAGRHPDVNPFAAAGGREPSADAVPKDPALWMACQMILAMIGLVLDSASLDVALVKAIEFFEKASGRRYEASESHRVGALREWIRILAAGVWRDEIHQALAEVDRSEQVRISRLISAAISTPGPGNESARPERLRIDPRCWNLPRGAVQGPSRYILVSQLAILVQLCDLHREMRGESLEHSLERAVH